MADGAVNRRGIAWMVLAMACYVLNDVCVKLTVHAFPPGQVLAVRGVAASMIVIAIASISRTPGHWRVVAHPMTALRCALEVTTAVFSVLALARSPLPTVTALMMTAPLLTGVLSVCFGWERPRGLSLAASSCGLVGVMLVLNPLNAGVGLGAGWALLCAVSLAARDLVTRRLPVNIPSMTVAVATTLAVCVSGLAMGSLEHWSSLTRPETGALSLAAVFTAAGNYALIAACRSADLSIVTPFRYSGIAWAVAAGFLIWGDLPGWRAAAGIALIIAAGASVLWRRHG